ncbi:MAG: GAF domain-containing protein, partial [Thermoflexales bacterium]|nr:GAF domain-containing protein [Thermoflexales bacterium]
MSIKQRTILGFTLMFLLVLIASGAGLGYSASAERTATAMYNGSKQIESITDLQMSLLTVVATVDNMLLTRQTNLIERRLNDELADFNQRLADLQTQTAGKGSEKVAQNQEIMSDLFLLGIELVDTVHELNALVQKEQWTQAQFLRHNNLASLQRRFGENLDRLRTNIQDDVETLITTTVHAQNLIRTCWVFITIVALGVGLLAGILVASSIIRPIAALAATATAIKGGDLSARAEVSARDEIGVLADVFNTMTTQLQQILEGLEQRVKARTQRLETVATLSGHLNSILDIERLWRELVVQTKETFNYYHVHIYLLNPAGDRLVLAEGYGEAGVQMKREQHSISLDDPTSLSARVAREQQAILVGDVRDEPGWQPLPPLSRVRSKLAVPIIQEDKTIGVLSVYSEQAGGLDEGDADMLRSLA